MSTTPELRAYTAQAAEGTLSITIEKEFDFGALSQDWAHSIITQHPGPFKEVRIDMSKCARVSSTFYAGLMQMHGIYTSKGARPLVLVKPDRRMMANLKILHLDQFFFVVE